MEELSIAYIIFVALIGYWASRLNRSVFWCIIGAMAFSPIIVGLYLLIAGRKGR